MASRLVTSAQAQSPNEFLTGDDISTLPVHEKQGFKFIDGGVEKPFFEIARNNGWSVMRVCLWVAPDARPESVACNLDNVTILGRRIKAAGFKLLLDIYYSDTWADPGHQKKPAAWADLGFPELVEKVRGYSRKVVSHLRENGAMPDIVQIGNEIKNGLLYGRGSNGAAASGKTTRAGSTVRRACSPLAPRACAKGRRRRHLR